MEDNHSTSVLISVDQPAEEVFNAINNVGAWWTGDPGITGKADKVGDEFTYRFGKVHYSLQRVVELVPSKKIAWVVLDSHLDFASVKTEWTGTRIVFELTGKGKKTDILFRHIGLDPGLECFNTCTEGWNTYIKENLHTYLTRVVQSHRIQREIDLKAPPARVWVALTNYHEFGQWFGVKLEGPFSVGKTVAGKITYPGFEHLKWAVEVKKMDKEKVFSFTWHPYAMEPTVDYDTEEPTLVEFFLEPQGSGTRLTVVESGFEKIPVNRRLEAFRMNEEGWTEQMENIAKYVG